MIHHFMNNIYTTQKQQNSRNTSQGHLIILQLHENNFRKILKIETLIYSLQTYLCYGYLIFKLHQQRSTLNNDVLYCLPGPGPRVYKP